MFTLNLTKEQLQELLNTIADEMNFLAKCNKYRTKRYYTLDEIYRKAEQQLYES